MLKFGHHFVLTVSNMQKCNPLKKLCLVYFLQKWLKNIKSQYSEIIMLGVFFKRLKWCFWIFKILRYFNHFWKNKQGKAFSTDDLLHICHIPNKMVSKNKCWLTYFFCIPCRWGNIIIYIWWKYILIIDLWPTKSLFYGYSKLLF